MLCLFVLFFPGRSRDPVLTPHHFSPADAAAGTFTITDVSSFGVKALAGIVPPPQACMLGLGAVQSVVAPAGVDADGAPAFKVVSRMSVTLSCDHRVVDGAVGAQWLQEFKAAVETPHKLML